jgi:hypothetical protein
LDPEDILIPSNYKGKSDDGSDIALIGLSKENRNLIIKFFKTQQDSQPEEFSAYKNSLCL